MKVTITIETGNAAFDGNEHGEVARILDKLARRIEEMSVVLQNADGMPLRDINGNTVGRVKVGR